MTDWDTIVLEWLARPLGQPTLGQISAVWENDHQQEDRMPDRSAPQKNPYRSDRRHPRQNTTGQDHPLAGFHIRDLDAMLAQHFEHGRQVGAGEVRDENAALLVAAYDEGWRGGMSERHDGITNAYGERLHGLHELLHLAPQLNLGSAAYAGIVELAHAVVGTLIHEHEGGPFAGPWDSRQLPATLGEPVQADDGDLPKSTAQQAEDAMRTRAIALRTWLEELVGGRATPADPEPSPDTAGAPADFATVARP